MKLIKMKNKIEIIATEKKNKKKIKKKKVNLKKIIIIKLTIKKLMKQIKIKTK